jgi:hypothetical protein
MKTKVLHWIDGQHADTGEWHPLYCYSDPLLARGIHRYIIDLDTLPRELAAYDDFRLRQEEPVTRGRRGTMVALDEPPEGSQEAAEAPRRPRRGSRTRRPTAGA